jgi:hypothetical protein
MYASYKLFTSHAYQQSIWPIIVALLGLLFFFSPVMIEPRLIPVCLVAAMALGCLYGSYKVFALYGNDGLIGGILLLLGGIVLLAGAGALFDEM